MRIIENRLTRLARLRRDLFFEQECNVVSLSYLRFPIAYVSQKLEEIEFPLFPRYDPIFERFRRSRFSPPHTSEFLNFRGLKRNDATSLKVREKHEEKCRMKNNER